MRRVESLENLFRAIRQRTVPELKSESAQSEVLLVRGSNAVSHERPRGAVVAPVPARAFRKCPNLKGPVAFRVRKRLVAAIVLAQPPKTPISAATSCSKFNPNPYLPRPCRREAVMSGVTVWPRRYSSIDSHSCPYRRGSSTPSLEARRRDA